MLNSSAKLLGLKARFIMHAVLSYRTCTWLGSKIIVFTLVTKQSVQIKLNLITQKENYK